LIGNQRVRGKKRKKVAAMVRDATVGKIRPYILSAH